LGEGGPDEETSPAIPIDEPTNDNNIKIEDDHNNSEDEESDSTD
jgi:hypothetical protein